MSCAGAVTESRTHCGEFVCRDFLLALCDGVEEQVLQAGQDACLPSPAADKTNTRREQIQRNNFAVRPNVEETQEGKLQQSEEGKKTLYFCKERL